jgi:hypothetical protein
MLMCTLFLFAGFASSLRSRSRASCIVVDDLLHLHRAVMLRGKNFSSLLPRVYFCVEITKSVAKPRGLPFGRVTRINMHLVAFF